MTRWIRIDPRDNVATALEDAVAGSIVDVAGGSVMLRDGVGRGHKVALSAICGGDPVIKFGFPIGLARVDIAAGEHVHSHNLATALKSTGAYERRPHQPPAMIASSRTFEGYVRADGRVATRNEIWVLPTVGCVGRTAERIASLGAARHAGRLDGIHAFQHPFGCSQLGEDLAGTRRILASLASHPNAAAALIVGLGCEENQFHELFDELAPERRHAIRYVLAQSVEDELASGAAALDELVEIASQAKRSTVPLSALVLGLKCGGSDGLSGLTANPLVGRMADAVTGAGGAAILTEIPEVFGAEQLLMDRARDEAVFRRTVDLVNDFKAYFVAHGQPVSENPSPGNVAGGITTLEEKSLGAVQKGGRATVTDVIRYGHFATEKGLTLLEAPGNDAVSCTALAAAGATMILFTTGRGTPLGFPVPTVKLASNSALAERKPRWIDFDAGRALDDGLDVVADALLDDILAIASGKPTCAELNGDREIAIWKRGVTL